MKDRLLTKREVAAFLRVSPKTVERMVQSGELRAIHPRVHSRMVRFDPEEVAALVGRKDKD
jgi:excisionase family DNA binding protein